MVEVSENRNLKKLNSFGLPAIASWYISFDNIDDLFSIINKEPYNSFPYKIIGSGTNLLFKSDFKGCLLHPVKDSIEIIEKSDNEVIVEAGAGLEWDKFVNWAVENNFFGIENLSLIPGTVGAAVVQNIGAYGAEIANNIVEVEVVDISNGKIISLSREDCKFAYRYSVFKEKGKESYLVWKVKLVLSLKEKYDLSYGNLSSKTKTWSEINLEKVRQLIISTRQSKLPDPDIIGNAGSFFKNPIIDTNTFNNLMLEHPDIPHYATEIPGKIKIPAAWLIEKLGWKGYKSKGAGVYEKQALVLVNHGNASGKDLFRLSRQIQISVKQRFGIQLEREVTIID